MEIISRPSFNLGNIDTRATQSATGLIRNIGNQAEGLQKGSIGNNITDLIKDLVNQLQGNSGEHSLDDLMARLQQILEQLQAHTEQAGTQAEQELAERLTFEIMKMAIRIGIMQLNEINKKS